MAFWVRKLLGTFKKRASGVVCKGNFHLTIIVTIMEFLWRTLGAETSLLLL